MNEEPTSKDLLVGRIIADLLEIAEKTGAVGALQAAGLIAVGAHESACAEAFRRIHEGDR